MADPRAPTAEEATAFDRIPRYNIRDGGEGTDNPYGFGEDGYITNQMRQANDVQIVGRYTRDMAQIASDNVRLAADQVRLASAQAALADEDATNTKADRIATGQDRAAAAGSAGQAAASAARFQGTSTTARTPAIGAMTLTTEAGKAFDVGTWLTAQSRGTAERWVFGKVTAYADTSVTLDVVAIGPTVSSGADWNLLVGGAWGPQGPQGVKGDPGAVQDITGKLDKAGGAVTGALRLEPLTLAANNGAADFSARSIFNMNMSAAMTLAVTNLADGQSGQVFLTYTGGALSFSGVDGWSVSDAETATAFTSTAVGAAGLVANARYEFVFTRAGGVTQGMARRRP